MDPLDLDSCFDHRHDQQSLRTAALDDLIERVGSYEALDELDAEPIPDEPFDWTDVTDQDRAFVSEVLALTDRCCAEHLDVEYRTIARRILARLVFVDPRPLRRSPNAARFAAGLVWLTGNANGLFQRRSRMKAGAVWSWFGVTSCVERGRSIRTAAGLIPAVQTVRGIFSSEHVIKLGEVSLLHSRTRAELVKRRDAMRTFHPELAVATPPPHRLPDGRTIEVHARPARAVVVASGVIAETNRRQLMIGLGEEVTGAEYFALSVPDAYDLLHRLVDELDDPGSGAGPAGGRVW